MDERFLVDQSTKEQVTLEDTAGLSALDIAIQKEQRYDGGMSFALIGPSEDVVVVISQKFWNILPNCGDNLFLLVGNRPSLFRTIMKFITSKFLVQSDYWPQMRPGTLFNKLCITLLFYVLFLHDWHAL